jgi:hypothetical protein
VIPADYNFKPSIQTNKEKMLEKDCLIEALARLAFAIADSDTIDDAAFNDIIRRLNSWVDVETTPNLMTLLLTREIRAKMYGLGLKCINAVLDDEAKSQECKIRPMSRSTLLEKRSSIFKTLGFDSLIENDIRVRTINCRKSFCSF